MMVGKHGIQTIEVVVVVLLLLLLAFEVFVLASAHPLLVMDKCDCPNILECQLI